MRQGSGSLGKRGIQMSLTTLIILIVTAIAFIFGVIIISRTFGGIFNP